MVSASKMFGKRSEVENDYEQLHEETDEIPEEERNNVHHIINIDDENDDGVYPPTSLPMLRDSLNNVYALCGYQQYQSRNVDLLMDELHNPRNLYYFYIAMLFLIFIYCITQYYTAN